LFSIAYDKSEKVATINLVQFTETTDSALAVHRMPCAA